MEVLYRPIHLTFSYNLSGIFSPHNFSAAVPGNRRQLTVTKGGGEGQVRHRYSLKNGHQS